MSSGMYLLHCICFFADKPTVLFTASAILPFVAIGTTVTLSCDVQSEPVAMVTLKHRNSVLESRVGSFSHSFQLQRNSNGSYSCDARNFMGLTSVQKEISVQGIVLWHSTFNSQPINCTSACKLLKVFGSNILSQLINFFSTNETKRMLYIFL